MSLKLVEFADNPGNGEKLGLMLILSEQPSSRRLMYRLEKRDLKGAVVADLQRVARAIETEQGDREGK